MPVPLILLSLLGIVFFSIRLVTVPAGWPIVQVMVIANGDSATR